MEHLRKLFAHADQIIIVTILQLMTKTKKARHKHAADHYSAIRTV